MIQFSILSGKQAGTVMAARHFPFRIGRSDRMHWQTDASGVWDEHVEIRLNAREGFSLHALSRGLAVINRQPVTEGALRNGDVIEIGALRLQFWLGETRGKRLGWREAMVWGGIAAVIAGQTALVHWLLNS